MDIKLTQMFSNVSLNLGIKYKIISEYYPYKHIKNTARAKKGILYVRVSDKLKDAPPEIKEALAYILLSKIKGTRVAPRYKRTYNDFIHELIINEPSGIASGLNDPVGIYFNLEEIFYFINNNYFYNELSKPALRWSKKKAYRIFGRYDRAKNEIVISRILDDKKTPRFVIEYIMYHEMLHIKFGFTYKKGRRRVHTGQFKKEEEKFSFYTESINYLKKISGREKRSLF